MSLFLMANTVSLQPKVLMAYTYNSQNCEDSYQCPSEFDPQLTDILWPRSQGLDGYGFSHSGYYLPDAVWFNWLRQPDTGARSCLLISGVSRDSNGAILPNCQITAYTTADNVAQGGPVTSANDGAFAVPTYSTANHYIVAYKTSSPSNLAGSSDTNLTGS